MKILAIDTAHGICSVALAENGVPLAQKTDNEPSRQAERLFLMIADLLRENNLSYADINAVAADVGPGSFTGVRIGLAAARGIALAAKIPIIGVTGFEALFHAAKSVASFKNLLVIFDARREQLFAQSFINNQPDEELLLYYNDIRSILNKKDSFSLIGNGIGQIIPAIKKCELNHCIIESFAAPDAAMIAAVAFLKLVDNNYHPSPSPLYIRPPDAKPQKNL